MWQNTTPSAELPRDLCAGIGPLQLGVVLVELLFQTTDICLTYVKPTVATFQYQRDEGEEFGRLLCISLNNVNKVNKCS